VIENVKLTEWMPIYAKELLLGSATLKQDFRENNNKFHNLLFLKEDE